MIELLRSKSALTGLTAAAGILTLTYVLIGLAYAIYNHSNSTPSQNLEIAGGWLFFVASFDILVTICYLAWEAFLERKSKLVAELGALSLATLILAIGFLITAIDSFRSPEAANVLMAIGIAGWGIVVLIKAAQQALIEQEAFGGIHQAGIRAVGALALLFLAVAAVLPNASITQKTLAITTNVFWAVGTAVLLVAVSIARSRAIFSAYSSKFTILGLTLISLSYVLDIVAVAIVYGPGPYNITSYRIAMSVPEFISAIGFLILAWAAFRQLIAQATTT
jgi:hypothetical protein